MKTTPIFMALILSLALFACKGGAKKLQAEDVKKIINVTVDGFDKKAEDKGMYGGPAAMFTNQADRLQMFVATNVHPEGTTFTDDLATAKMSFDSSYGEVKQSQVNGKNVYTQTGNANGTAQYKVVVYQADYRFTFGANGKDATKIKEAVDKLVEKVVANMKK